MHKLITIIIIESVYFIIWILARKHMKSNKETERNK